MVSEPDATTTEEQSTTTSDGSDSLSLLEAVERISTLMQPAVQLLTVVVQGLTAFVLVRQI